MHRAEPARAPARGPHIQGLRGSERGTSDSFTLCIGHGEPRGDQIVAVIDCVREVKPPFSPKSVVRDFAALLASYKFGKVIGDKYAGIWPAEAFGKQGVVYEPGVETCEGFIGGRTPTVMGGGPGYRTAILDPGQKRIRAPLPASAAPPATATGC